MRNIATRLVFGININQPACLRPPNAVPFAGVKNLAWTAVLGMLSLALYGALFLNGATLNAYAEAARHGDHAYSLVPIGIAFVFSLVHGTFTGQFWDVIGLKPKNGS